MVGTAKLVRPLGRLLNGLIVFVSLSALAASPKLKKAEDLYDDGAFAQAKGQLKLLTSDPSLSEADRAQARLYLAAAEFALGDSVGAHKELQTLALVHPEVKPDPNVFLPDFVALADAARREAGVSEGASRRHRRHHGEEGEVAKAPANGSTSTSATSSNATAAPPGSAGTVQTPPAQPPPVAPQQPPAVAQTAPTHAPDLNAPMQPTPAPVATTSTVAEGPSAKPWLISGGAAMAVGVVGVVYGLSVHSKIEDQLNGTGTGVSKSDAQTGALLFNGGLAVTAIGAGLLGYGIYKSVHTPSAVAIAPMRGGASVVTEVQF